MAKMPGATWRPIPRNYTAGGMGAIRGVVIHIMDGTLAGTDSWFRSPAAQASSHFGTGKTGALYQWVDTRDKAWAEAGGNPYWISIENEGRGGDRLTDAQLNACARVLAWAHKTHGVPLQSTSSPSGRGLGHHSMGGSAWGGHTSCPGAHIIAQKPEIIRRAKAIAGGHPVTEEDDVPIRSSYGKSRDQTLPWGEHTVIQWDQEWADPKHAHGDASKDRPQGYPGYVSPLATWADMNVSLRVDGLAPGDYWQVQYQVHDWKGGKSAGKWTECAGDFPATTGNQYVTGAASKGLSKGQHVYVAVAVFPAGGDAKGRPAPKAVAGRWTIAQDKA